MKTFIVNSSDLLDPKKNPGLVLSPRKIMENKNIEKKSVREPLQVFSVRLKNLGTVNKNVVTLQTNRGVIDLWFSYETIVGFTKGYDRYCIQNQWGTTTGKLLNEIMPDKKRRLSEAEFNEALSDILDI